MAKKVHFSPAFLRGFVEGFAAPMCFYGGVKYRRVQNIDTSLTEAWRSVGRALDESYRGEIAKNGKAADKKERERISA